MATTSATMSPAAVITSAVAGAGKKSLRTAARVNYITGLNSFGGLKAHNNVVSLGLPVSADQSFAKIVSALNAPSRNTGGNGGGALSSTCNAAISEIFRIASIIPALVLVGVAVGFVLLRIESSVEEAE